MSKSLANLIYIDLLRRFKNKTDSAYVQTGAVDQTIAGTKTFSKPMVGSVTGSSGSCTGNAATATRADSAANADTATNANYANSAGIAPSSDSVKGRGWLPNGVDMTTLTSGSYQCSPNNLPSQGAPYGMSTYGELLVACGSQYTSIIYIDVFGNSACWSSNQQAWVINVHSGNIGSQSVNYANSAGSAATATTATTAQACTGNAASATKLAAKRTIALSGAATGTATSFDGSGNITIPVTALSGSAITSAISIYDLVPDGAANHRNFYRGKDITAAFNNGTVSANIANGTFRDIFPGDYITKSITVPQILKADGTTEYIAQKTYTVNFVIADLDIWLNRGDTAPAAHHVAIVPQSVVFNSCMNESNVTTGGYLGSFMNTNVIPAFATGLQNAFGASHLISFRIGLSNGVTTTTASASHPYWTGTSNWWGAWTSEICCLMSEGMVYGQSPNHSAAMDETMCGQFAAFRLNSSLVYNRQNYWLSDVVSSAHFATVFGLGDADALGASYVFGVRPFALLK